MTASPVFSSGLGGIMCRNRWNPTQASKWQAGMLSTISLQINYLIPHIILDKNCFPFMDGSLGTLNNHTMNTMNFCNRSFPLTLMNNSMNWSVFRRWLIYLLVFFTFILHLTRALSFRKCMIVSLVFLTFILHLTRAPLT